MKNNIFIRAHRDAPLQSGGSRPAPTSNQTQTVGAIHESPEMILNENGKIVDSVLESLSKRFPIELDIYQIMPNHVHMIVCIVDHERAIRESPVNGNNQNVSIGDFGY